MARRLLVCLVIANFIATLATARPLLMMVHTTALELHSHGKAHPPSSSSPLNFYESGIAHSPEKAMLAKHQPFDRSIAGAEVILGGLATTIFAAIFCYIRVTRQRTEEEEKS
ncbi:uncharacterized protein A4U43_C03F9060 [Asparagus officinalis]|uniref:Uncharacterized protein n=1 Tax=Asparagus officinalis TaxID=4686 RepID=A0A5P1F928_ASPOF|nr:uncharacterized protein A4U43_C03F9060 [Asparagus officinalis]